MAGDEIGASHGGAVDFFIVDEGGLFRKIDLACAERLRCAEDASDVIGGTDMIEIDGDLVGERGFRDVVASADVGKQVVFFERESCLVEVPMIAVGKGAKIGRRESVEPHPGKIGVVVEQRFGGKRLFRMNAFVNAPKELGAFFMPLIRVEKKKFPFCKISSS
jgi:hypothetical protein